MKSVFYHRVILIVLFHFGLFKLELAAQKSTSVFEAKTLTWYGLDFSHAKMVGQFAQFKDAGQKGGESIKNTYFNAWNNVIKAEPDKYELNKFLHTDKVNLELEKVNNINSKVDDSQLMSMQATENKFSSEQIQKMIRKYANTGQGIGVVFLVEKFDKFENQGYVQVVYFDEKNGEVLFSDRLNGKSGGFGIKNYWIKSIYNIFKDIENSKWRKWKKKASKG